MENVKLIEAILLLNPGAGHPVLAALRQKEPWKTRDGRVLTPEEMDDSHRRALSRWLEVRAGTFYQYHLDDLVAGYLLSPGPNGDAASLAFDEEFDRLLDKQVGKDWEDDEALNWLHSQPLFQRLQELSP